MKGVPAKELVRQGFWNGVGNLALGGLVVAALAVLAFVVPVKSQSKSGGKANTSCGCA